MWGHVPDQLSDVAIGKPIVQPFMVQSLGCRYNTYTCLEGQDSNVTASAVGRIHLSSYVEGAVASSHGGRLGSVQSVVKHCSHKLS